MKEIALEDVDRRWNTPCPAVFVTSVDEAGKPNIIAVGWIMRANMEPPVYAIGINDKSRSGENIAATGEFAIGVPPAEMGPQMIYCGTHSGAEVDKFGATGLTPAQGKSVRAPLIGECLVNLECKVVAVQQIRDHRVFFGEVVCGWEAEGEGKPLLIVGEENGYERLHEEKGFRLGKVKD